jgi:hypothetical protein
MTPRKRVAQHIAGLRQYCQEAEHGTRTRYMTGCRCLRCRAANSNYNTSRRAAKENGDFRGLVSAARALAHIKKLSAGEEAERRGHWLQNRSRCRRGEPQRGLPYSLGR